MNQTTSKAAPRCKKSGDLPGQSTMFALNMPAPGEPKAKLREYTTEEELCENTACPVPHTDTPRCSNNCQQFEREHELDKETSNVEKTTCFCKLATCEVTGSSTRKQIGIVTIKRRGF